MIEPLHDFLDSVDLPLHYNPNYDPGHNNWIDGIDALPGNIVAMTGYDGILNDDGSPSSTNSYNTMIYSNNYGKTAFLAFDVIGLFAGLSPSNNQYWIGAHTYNNYNVSPLGLVYEWLEEAPFIYDAFINISSDIIFTPSSVSFLTSSRACILILESVVSAECCVSLSCESLASLAK